MRGKPDNDDTPEDVERIIPAHAGQTAWGNEAYLEQLDHPRACGANGRLAHGNCEHVGSSPRMRGKHQ